MSKYYDYYAEHTVTRKRFLDPVNNSEDARFADKDDALLPGKIIVNPTDPKYADDIQRQRSAAFTTRTPKGRIFISYMSGPHGGEAPGAYIKIISSDDEGISFCDRIVIAAPNENNTYPFDANMWVDEKGSLWIFWNQTYAVQDGRAGVWMARCDNPDEDDMKFTQPRRIANGVLVRRPLVIRNGDWLLPIAVWDTKWAHGYEIDTLVNWLPDEVGINVYRSADHGETFERIASNIRFPYSTFDEPCIVEKKDGTLWMWIRGKNCIGECFSYDGGHTWTAPRQNTRMNLPDTRFTVERLKSGNLLLGANYRADMFSYYGGRNHLTALISRDDGETWEGFLSIDAREGAEQPDFVEAENGFIYMGYGRAPQIAGETLLAIITEEDILAGKLVNPQSRLRILAGKAKGISSSPEYKEWVEVTAHKYNIEL